MFYKEDFMNFFKKAMCLCMVALLLLSVCACGTTTEDPADTQAATQADGTNVETEIKETLDIPETRYDDHEITFLTRDEAEWSTTEIFAEKDKFNESNISEAVYTRNDIILQNYGVTILEYKVNTGEMTGKIQQAVSAGGDDFQAVISNCNTATSASTNGYIWNLNSVDTSNIDLTKSWWDGKLAEGMTISDMVFFATGDLLTSDNDATFCMMFNKKIASDNGIPNLYELVSNYEWTFDKLYEYEQLPVMDKGGDGKLDYDTDVAGFAMTNDVYYSMLYAGGVTVISRDQETGDPIYNLDVELAQNIAESAQRIFAKDYIININNETTTDVFTIGKVCFGDGHALFLGEVLQCVERMRDYDVEFGVIPYPQYDASQKEYHHMMHSTGSVVSIPRQVTGEKIEMVSAMIEAMAYYSQDTLTKQYYEINLTSKFAKDEESGPMIDLILDSRVYDLSYYYGWGNVMGTLTTALHEGANTGIASSNKKLQQKVERDMKNAISSIEKKYNSLGN